MAEAITWLHLTDLHCGGKGLSRDWPTVRARLEDDLEHMTGVVGAQPDLVLFTGDLAFSGSEADYQQAATVIADIDRMLGGRRLPWFAVPGNHDLGRPGDDELADFAFLTGEGATLRSVRERMLAGDAKLLDRAAQLFQGWGRFTKEILEPRLVGVRGLLPGDHRVTFTKGALKLGLVGVNSVWRHLDDDAEKHLSVDPRQLHALIDDRRAWRTEHTLCLLLQHHPPHWLEDERQWRNDVAREFDAVLFGHMHEHDVTSKTSLQGSEVYAQGMSLFGLEHYGRKNEDRRIGYAWGRLTVVAGRTQVHVFPRTYSTAGRFEHPSGVAFHEAEGMRLVDREPRRPALPVSSAGPRVAAVKDYLDWGVDEYGHIPVIGFDRDKIRLSLDGADGVYVRLTVQADRHTEELRPARKEAGAETVPQPTGPTGIDEVLDAVAQRGLRGVVVLGDPGSGKTTLLKHLFLRAERGDLPASLPHGLMPVFARLTKLDAADTAPRWLARLLRKELEVHGHGAAADNLFGADGKAKPRLFLLLDGLDEVADEPTRDRVSKLLDAELSHLHSDTRIVVTCRNQAYRRETRLTTRFLGADLHWLNAQQVRDFVTRWFHAVYRQRGEPALGAQKAEALLQALLDQTTGDYAHDYGLRQMTENPLLLSNVCLMFHMGEKLPERRGELYHRCVSLLLVLVPLLKRGAEALPDSDAREVLQPLAWAMHERKVKSLTVEEARQIIAQPLAQVRSLGFDADAFLAKARVDAGILTGKDIDTVDFLHLGFQEYLAAAHAAAQGLSAKLVERLGDPWWREVIRLAMTFSGVFRPFLAGVIEAGKVSAHASELRVCCRESVRTDLSPVVEALTRAADDQELSGRAAGEVQALLSVFAESRPVELFPVAHRLVGHRHDHIRKAAATLLGLPQHAPRVPAPPPQLGPDGRGRAEGESFVEPTTGIEFRWVPAGRFWMGSGKDRKARGYDPQAFDNEVPMHEVDLTRGFWIARHPVTNAQFEWFRRQQPQMESAAYINQTNLNKPQQPVVGVDHSRALLFCASLSKVLPPGMTADLPTEAEWERAARGCDGRKFPWGSDGLDPARAHFAADGTAEVGLHPLGASPCGAEDMVGNVWEWCADEPRRYSADLVVDPALPWGGRSEIPSRGQRVVRGGSWGRRGPRYLRCATRGWVDPWDRGVFVGFRVVCRGSPEHVR